MTTSNIFHMNKLTEHFFKASIGVFTQFEVAMTIDGSDFSRHGLVKRALAAGEIINIRRGLYCLAQEFQKKPISTYSLAQRIYGPSYLSLETALSHHGWIPEAVYTHTSVSYRNSRDFETPFGIFSYQRVPQLSFFTGVERRTDDNGNIFFMATPAKALADYVYLLRLNWTTIDEVRASLRIELEDLMSVTHSELNELTTNYSNSRVKRFLRGWQEARLS